MRSQRSSLLDNLPSLPAAEFLAQQTHAINKKNVSCASLHLHCVYVHPGAHGPKVTTQAESSIGGAPTEHCNTNQYPTLGSTLPAKLGPTRCAARC